MKPSIRGRSREGSIGKMCYPNEFDPRPFLVTDVTDSPFYRRYARVYDSNSVDLSHPSQTVVRFHGQTAKTPCPGRALAGESA